MKKIIYVSLFILVMCSFAIAQSQLPEFYKAKEIKLLESNRKDVKRILADFKSDVEEDKDQKVKNNEPIYSETFSNKNADIEVSYSSGDCSDDSDETDKWNVPKGKVTLIEISLNEGIKLTDFKFNFSDFRKEQQYANVEDLYIYYNKNLGIAFEVSDGEINIIHLFPTRSYYSRLCENEEAEESKEFYSTQSWFGNWELKDRNLFGCTLADVTDVSLSESVIIVGCGKSANKNCSNSKREVSVTTIAVDPEGDVLTYAYTVSGGKIVGTGSQVVWDLWGVEPGTYTITAAVDDGCGFCGRTVTKSIVIKDCPDC